MWKIVNNLFGSAVIDSVAAEYVAIGAVILIVVLVLWMFDLVVQLFKNFWK